MLFAPKAVSQLAVYSSPRSVIKDKLVDNTYPTGLMLKDLVKKTSGLVAPDTG
jgi:hypothetical protein